MQKILVENGGKKLIGFCLMPHKLMLLIELFIAVITLENDCGPEFLYCNKVIPLYFACTIVKIILSASILA